MKTYTLWKDNRLDQEYKIDREELIKRFAAWLQTKGAAWVAYYNTERIVRDFLTANEGMSSVFNEADVVAFIEDLSPAVREYELNPQAS